MGLTGIKMGMKKGTNKGLGMAGEGKECKNSSH